VRFGKSLNGHLISGGGLLKYWAISAWPIIDFRNSYKSQSPCDMQLMFLAAQRQGVGAKFSPIWKVGRDIDQYIRWSVAPLDK
jgi:hypothetical protein